VFRTVCSQTRKESVPCCETIAQYNLKQAPRDGSSSSVNNSLVIGSSHQTTTARHSHPRHPPFSACIHPSPPWMPPLSPNSTADSSSMSSPQSTTSPRCGNRLRGSLYVPIHCNADHSLEATTRPTARSLPALHHHTPMQPLHHLRQQATLT
jgi:hypothetical protein